MMPEMCDRCGRDSQPFVSLPKCRECLHLCCAVCVSVGSWEPAPDARERDSARCVDCARGKEAGWLPSF